MKNNNENNEKKFKVVERRKTVARVIAGVMIVGFLGLLSGVFLEQNEDKVAGPINNEIKSEEFVSLESKPTIMPTEAPFIRDSRPNIPTYFDMDRDGVSMGKVRVMVRS